jgi:hypothetical protein
VIRQEGKRAGANLPVRNRTRTYINRLQKAAASLGRGRLIVSQPDIYRVAQEVVRSPGEIGNLGNEPRLDPMDAR